MTKRNWKVIGHNHQSPENGDKNGIWELTDGKLKLFTENDVDVEEFDKILEGLNEIKTNFYVDNNWQFRFKLEEQEMERLYEFIVQKGLLEEYNKMVSEDLI